MKYEINGGNLPTLSCRLEAGESLDCQAGAMAVYDPSIEMNTAIGGVSKFFGRAFTNERIFRNTFTANQAGEIVLSSAFPGEIVPVRVTPNKSVVVQKHSYLASCGNINDTVFFTGKISTGLFGGEGFILQKFSGDGMVFAEVDGSVIKYSLSPGEEKLISTGYVAMMDETCDISVITVKGVKNILFGGEGIFLTKVIGPGDVYVQSMPIYRTAGLLYRYMPKPRNNN